ncbi:MAG: 6-carboxytetrahydropterin synthase [Gemmatimonadetes bacterium]|nr:6-carboxytetrahydropterin synthase [Gemmatimonadota bacterium]
MTKVTVTRRLHFSAAHRLHIPDLSDADNQRLFGLCDNPNYHGHNYEIEVSVSGDVDPQTGYVADLGTIKEIVESEVITLLDHKNLNLDVEQFRGVNPTAENIVVVIWKLLEGKLPSDLTKIVLWETPRNYVEYTGD